MGSILDGENEWRIEPTTHEEFIRPFSKKLSYGVLQSFYSRQLIYLYIYLTGIMTTTTPEQREDADHIAQRIRQFRILYEAWQDDGFDEDETLQRMRMFRMREMANEILEKVREHLRKYNIHNGITVDMLTEMQ